MANSRPEKNTNFTNSPGDTLARASNLIRHVMIVVAKSLNVEVRDLSFSRVLKRIYAISSVVYNTGLSSHADRALNYLFTDLKCLKLPNRMKKRPNEPRKILQKGKFQFMTKSCEEERNNLKSQKIK